MRVKALYREYNDLLNTVSGTQGSNVLNGNGTEFLSIPVNTALEVDGIGFIGKIASVQSDTSLTLDRNINETFSGNIFWQDWTPWLISFSTLPQKAESDKPAEAGAIVFDKISFEFYHVTSIKVNGLEILNPVVAALSGDIDSKKKCLLKFQAIKKDFYSNPIPLVTNDYKYLIDNLGNYISANFKADQMHDSFVGMIDFESIDYPEVRYKNSAEVIKRITFDVLDKFSALSLIDSSNMPRTVESIDGRISSLPYKDRTMGFLITDDNSPAYIKEFGLFFSNGDFTSFCNLSEVVYQIGDIIIHPDDVLLDYSEQRLALVTESYLETQASLILHVGPGGITHNFLNVTYNRFKIFTYSADFNPLIYNGMSGTSLIPKFYDSTKFLYWDKAYYGGQIGIIENINGKNTLTAYDAISITSLFITGIWKDVAVTSRMYKSDMSVMASYPIPLNNFGLLIGPLPFDKEPIDALIYLGNTLQSYILFESDGNAIIQNRDGFQFTPAGNDIILPNFVGSRSKRPFWDKLSDAVEITVDSWIYDNDVNSYYQGKSSKVKKLNSKARNKISKSLIVDLNSIEKYGMSIQKDGTLSDPTLPDGTQEDILNRYASLKASEYFDFYGKRHVCYNITIVNISWEMLSWKLLDTFSYNGERFFATNLEFDLANNQLQLEIVSIVGYNYNSSTVLIAQVDENYSSSSYRASSSSSTDGTIVLSGEAGYWSGSGDGLNPALGRRSLELDKYHSPEFGSVKLVSKTVTENYLLTIKENVLLCDCSGGDIIITLPPEASFHNIEFIIQKTDDTPYKVIIAGTVSGIVNPEMLRRWDDIKIKKCGTVWIRLGAINFKRQCIGDPEINNIYPLYAGEEIIDINQKLWYKSVGLTNKDWRIISNYYKTYSDSADPNGNIEVDYIGQWCLVTYAGESNWWKSKNLNNDSWAQYIDNRSATQKDEFLISEETFAGSGIFQFMIKTFVQVKQKLGLLFEGTTSDHIVTFADEKGTLKESGKLISDFVEKVNAPENNFPFFDNAGKLKDSHLNINSFMSCLTSYTENNFLSIDDGGYAKDSGVNAAAFLSKNNTDTYTPSSDYNPATKKYVDENRGIPYYEGISAPTQATLGMIWYNPSTGKACLATSTDNWIDLN